MSKNESPSASHRNRKPHNYLIYDLIDKSLVNNIAYIRGVLIDLGCGEMPYREWFLKYADTYTGVDWASTLHTLKADVIADLNVPIPIETETADTVISLSVMEHLHEPQNLLNEAYRILKPGGAILLQVPFMWAVHEAPYDYYRFTRYGLTHMFKKAGFQGIIVSEQSGFWVMWFLKLNYQLSRLIRGPKLVKKIISVILRLIWIADQPLARLLDRFWKCESETSSYFVVARKL